MTYFICSCEYPERPTLADLTDEESDEFINEIGQGFVFMDPRPIAAARPYSFPLPGSAELNHIQAGDRIAVMQDRVTDVADICMRCMAFMEYTDLIWTTVTRLAGDRLVLCPQDLEIDAAALKEGEIVAIDRRYVVDIEWANPDAAPARDAQKYDQWCYVDEAILEGSALIGVIRRVTPKVLGENASRDSGWRILRHPAHLVQQGADQVQPVFMGLDQVLDRDDSWLSVIDAPVGAEFMRDFETGVWSQVR